MSEEKPSEEAEKTEGEGEKPSEAEEKPKRDMESNIKLLIDAMSEGKKAELNPVFDQVHGYRYTDVEEIVGDVGESLKILETLASRGILAKKLIGKHIVCPHCQSPNFTTHLLCPSCKSHNINKRTLLEHLNCGHIGTDDQYMKEGRLLCPKCNLGLEKLDSDHRKVGVWFECLDCKKRSDEPFSTLWCRSCKERFSIRDAVLVDSYSYVLGKEAAVEAKRRISVFLPITSFLESAGYKLDTVGTVPGTSGTSHKFDIVGMKEGASRLVIDVVESETEVGEHPVIMMFAKIYDIGESQAILIALPSLSKPASQLAVQYKITVIEAKDAEEAVARLKETLTGS